MVLRHWWKAGVVICGGLSLVGCAEPVADTSGERSTTTTAEVSPGASAGISGGDASLPAARTSSDDVQASSPSGSAAVQPRDRGANPFGAAGLIQPADPLLGGVAGGTAAPAGGVGSGGPARYGAAPGDAGPSGPPATTGAVPSGDPFAAGPPGSASPNPPAGQTERVPAQVGVGRRGRSLDQFNSGVQRVIAEPARSLFAARERIVFQITIPHAMQLFQAEHGYLPRSHDEFMREIIQANHIQLPELPAGHRYVYDPQQGELMVERPAR